MRSPAVVQAARDLDLHANVLRVWVQKLASDPGHTIPGHGPIRFAFVMKHREILPMAWMGWRPIICVAYLILVRVRA